MFTAMNKEIRIPVSWRSVELDEAEQCMLCHDMIYTNARALFVCEKQLAETICGACYQEYLRALVNKNSDDE